ncbi:zinc finger homeobox protein 2 [Xenopus laevis]|uniref:Zinc finger homeobox protein 2 n=1 Tax=Xenopus laevis TaxID=8355 RepID=A0A8J0V3G8_XENLA|nr:zinc finger homeobox protein 2 [Xenopus laevis]
MDAGECFLSSPGQDERSSWPLDLILTPCPEATKDTSLLPPIPPLDISTSTSASTTGGSYQALSPQPSTSQSSLLVATSPHPTYLPKLRTPVESNCQEEEEDEGEPLLGRVLFSGDGYVYLLKGEGKKNQTIPSSASPQDSLNSTVLPYTPPTTFCLTATYQGIRSNQISQHTSAGAANPNHLVSGASSKIQDQPKENKVVERGQETNKTPKLTRGSQRTQIVESVFICLPCQLTFRSGSKFGWHASHIHVLEHPYQDHLEMGETSGIIHSSSGQLFLSLIEPKINHSSLEAGQEPENIALLGDRSPSLLEKIQTVLEPSGKSKDVTSQIPDIITKSQVATHPETNFVTLGLARQSSLSFHCCDPAGTPHLTEAKDSKAHMNEKNGGASLNPAETESQGEEDVEEEERPPRNSQPTDITEQLLANQSFYGPMMTSSFPQIGVAPGTDKRGDQTDTECGLQALDDCTATSGPQPFQSLSLQGQLSLLHSRNSCKTLKCPKCNWHYKYQQTLDVHMKEKHPESQSHCSYCHSGQQHPRLARGESYNCGYKPYRCEACNYSTTTKGNLTIHMQSDKHLANLQSYQGPGTTPNAAVPPLASPVANTGQGEAGQPSPPDRQLKQKASWHCKVCNYETNISRNLRIHMTSEKHMQNVLMLHQGLGMGQDTFPFYGSSLAPDQGMDHHLLFNPMHFGSSGNQACSLLTTESASGPQLNSLGPSNIPIPSSALLQDSFSSNLEEEPSTGIFRCLICRSFTTDSLEGLLSHASRGRSLPEREWREVRGDLHCCRLCSYSTQLKANFQLHLKTDKHAQKYQLAAHMREGGAALATAQASAVELPISGYSQASSFPPLNLRCNLCGFDSNSREKLQLHVQGGGHEESLRVYKFLNSMDGAGESDTSFRCSPCDSIVSSCLGMTAHLRSPSHHQSLAQWRLTQGEVMLEGIISVCRGPLPQEHVKTLRSSEFTPNPESDEESKGMSQSPGPDEAASTECEKPAEGTTVFCCPFCAYVSPSEDQVQSHAVSQHALQPTFRCPLCQEQLMGTANLRGHLGHGHNVVSECVEKLLQVAQKVEISFHTRILPIRVTEEPSQPSSEAHTSCDIPHQHSPPESPSEISTSPVQATEYSGDLEKSQEDNSCTMCQQLSNSSNDLRAHLEKDHLELNPSDIQQACEVRSREIEVLELDDKTGSQENVPTPPQQVTYRKITNFAMDKFLDPSRPHKCVVCKESFTQKNILLVHYNSVSHLHKVRKASLDPSLSNRQDQGAALQSHGAQSGQDKPYKCTVCHVSYNQSSTLEIHMRSVLHQTRSRGSKYDLAKAPTEKSHDTICKNEHMNDGKNEPSGDLQSVDTQKRRPHIAPCLGVPILPSVTPAAMQLSLDLPRPPPLVQPPPLFASSLLPSFPLIPEALLKLQRQQQQLLLPFYLQELKVGGDGSASPVLPFGGAQQPPSIKEEGDQYSATPRAAKEKEDKMPDEQEAATGEADGCQNSESKLEHAPKEAGDPNVSTARTLLENFGFELVAQYNEGRQPTSSHPQVQPPPPAAPRSDSPTPPSAEKLQCGTCGKLFSNRLILKTHEEHMHQRLLPFEALSQYAAHYRRSYDSHNPTGVPMETPSSSVTPLDFSVTSQCSQQTEEKEESADFGITAEQLNCLHSLLDLSNNPVEEHFLWAANKTGLPLTAIQQWYAQEKKNYEGQEEAGAEASKYDRMGNRRFSRTKFSDFQTHSLNSFFEYSAYPRDSEVENLSTLLSLPGRVVVVWFQNARQKARKQAFETGTSTPPLLPSPPGERPASNSKVPPCKKCGITMPCIFQLIRHLKECYSEQHEEVADEEIKQEVPRNVSQEDYLSVKTAAPEIPLISIQVKDEEQKALEETNIVPSDAKERVKSSTINEENPRLSEQKGVLEEQKLTSTHPEMVDQNQSQATNNNVSTNLMDLSLEIPAGPSDTGTQRKRKHEEESLSPTCSEGGDEPPKDKRLRTTILPEQLDILHRWYLQDSNPTRSTLDRISYEVHLKKRVVQVWFQNTRARERKGQYRGAPPTVASGSRQQDDAPNEGAKREATTSFYYSVSPSQVTPSIVTKSVSCPGQGSSPLLSKAQTSLGMTSTPVTSKSLVSPSQVLSGILNTTQILPNLVNPSQAIPSLVKSAQSLAGLVNPPQGLPSLVNPTQTFPTLVNPAQVLSTLVNSPQSSPGLLLASYPGKHPAASILLPMASDIKPQSTPGLLSSSQLSGDQTQKRDKIEASAVVDIPDQNKVLASEQHVRPPTPENHPLESQGESNQKSAEKGASKPLESLIHSPQGGEMSDSSNSDPGPPSPGKGGLNSDGLFGSTGARRFRTQMSSLQLRILKACYSEYRTPSMQECDSLGGEIGLQKRVIQVWFQNARAKEKKAKLQGLSSTVTSNEGPQPTECTHCNVKYGPTTPCRAHIFSRQHITRLRAAIQQQLKEESRYRDNHPAAVAPLVSENKQTSQMLSFQGSNSLSPQIQRITPLLIPGQGIPAPIGGLATFNAGPPPSLLGITSTVPSTLLPRATPAAPTSSHSNLETMVDSLQPTATPENTGSAALKGASLMGTHFMPFPLAPAATPLFTPQIQGPYFQQLYGLKKRLFPINPVIPHTLLGLLPGSLKPNPEPSPPEKTDFPQTKATNQCSGEQEAMTGEEESVENEDDLEDEDIPMVDVAIRYQCQRCKMSFDEEGEAEAHQGSGCYPGSLPHQPPLRLRVCTYHCLSCQVLLQGPAARNQHLRSQQHRAHSMCGDGASSAIPQLRPKSAATSVLMAL